MAVSVDTVYQKVLAFANKEQRGYITPQEFNLFADQAQMEIFEQYFYDINQFRRVPGNNHQYADMVTNLQEKIDLFDSRIDNVQVIGQYGQIQLDEQITDLYRLGRVLVNYSGVGAVKAEYHTYMENETYGESPLTRWTKKRPIYNRFIGRSLSNPALGSDRIKIWPHPEDGVDIVTIWYTKKPLKPNWGYVVINDKPLYNSDTSTDFELHPSEESELVYRILAFAGIAIEKPQLTQTAAGLEQAKVQQEKQ